MSSWQEIAKDELEDLKSKNRALYGFMGTDIYYSLSEVQQDLLKTQLEIMRAYECILVLRLKDGKA